MHHGGSRDPAKTRANVLWFQADAWTLNLDQGDPQIGTFFTPEMLDRFPDRDFQRRPHDTRSEVTAANASIAQSQHSVEMQARLEIISFRNIAHQTQHLALLIDS